MAAVVSVGARAFVDKEGTNPELVAVCVGLFAESDDGRRVGVDPSCIRHQGPRQGIGAVWVESETPALESSYRLRPKDIEDSVRRQLLHGGPPVGWGKHASQAEVEQDRLARERCAGHLWSNLVQALAAEGIDATVESFWGVPFRMEFDAELVAELARGG